MPVKRGDKVAVITRSLCRYEGNYLSMNPDEQTFTLGDVRAFGTENRQAEEFFPGVQNTYECVEFNAGDVQSLSIVDFHDLRDPAIVNMGDRRRNDNHERSYYDYFRGPTRESSNRNRSYVHGSRSYGSGGPNRSFRNDWIGLGSRSEGSFPQRHPGAHGNSLEEFDFEKGIEEFTQLKLNESLEDADPEKETPGTTPEKSTPLEEESAGSPYDKQRSFFDNLSGTSSVAPRKPHYHQRIKNPNVETFGLDTVQQLYEYRRFSSDQRTGFRSGRGGYRRNNNGYNDSTTFHGPRSRQNLGPFQNAVKFH